MNNRRDGNKPKGEQKEVEQNSVPFDLRKVNPSGRVDVLAANLIERLAQTHVPDLVPVLEQRREVIHATLNENFGPHAFGFDLQGLIKEAQPYVPIMKMIAGQILANYAQNQQADQRVNSGKSDAEKNGGGKAA